MNYFDAHNHLHDSRLDDIREDAIASLTAAGIRGAIVNGTSEQDWPAVAAFAAIAASFGWALFAVGELDEHSTAAAPPAGFVLRTSRLMTFFFVAPVSGALSGCATAAATF